MKNKLPLILIGLCALVAGIIVSAQFSNSSAGNDKQDLAQLQSTLKTSVALPLDFKQVPDFQLQDVNGAPLTQAVFEDHWSVVFFGYTHCPDVCPITLQVMKNVVKKLTEEGKEAPQVVFVTVDPIRDTAEIMKNYISFFSEDFVGITGELNDVHAVTKTLGIVASFTANKEDPDNYIVDHTASLLLIDPEKRVRAKISPPHVADTIAEDFLAIIAASR